MIRRWLRRWLGLEELETRHCQAVVGTAEMGANLLQALEVLQCQMVKMELERRLTEVQDARWQ